MIREHEYDPMLTDRGSGGANRGARYGQRYAKKPVGGTISVLVPVGLFVPPTNSRVLL